MHKFLKNFFATGFVLLKLQKKKFSYTTAKDTRMLFHYNKVELYN